MATLAERVRKIDPIAAMYVEKCELYPYFSMGDLSGLFEWKKTPQGHQFWERINDKLCEDEQ